jgi:hypothetical protein
MLLRILFSYTGAIVGTSYLLLFNYCKLSGVIIFLLFFVPSLPIGIICGLIYSDIRRNILERNILFRTLISVAMYAMFFASLPFIERYIFNYEAVPLMLMSLVFVPLWCAVPSEFVFRC